MTDLKSISLRIFAGILCMTIISCTDNTEKAKEELKKGIIFMHQSAPDKALPHFNNALSLNPEFTEAYFYRGNALMNLQDYDNAFKDYTTAIELDSTFMDAYVNRGNLHFLLGDRDNACRDLRKAEALGKDNLYEKLKFCPEI